jgi:hypothetical protein
VFPFKAYFYALKMKALISSETLANFYNSQIKGKANPVQAWTDPEGSRRVRLPGFKTIGTYRW